MNLHTTPEPPFKPVMSERRVAGVGAVLTMVGPVSMMVFTPAMPEMVRAFGTTEAMVKLTLSFFFAGFAISQLICGPLSDGFGRKPAVYGFIGIYLAATLFGLFAPTIEGVIAARFLQGLGAGVGLAMARAIVRDLYTTESAVRIMNLIIMMLSIGPSISPVLGGLVMELAGWQAIFLLMVALAGLILLVARFAMVETISRDLSRIRPKALLAAYRELLGSRYFMSASMIPAFSIGAIYALATILPFILMNRLGLSPVMFGLTMMAQSMSFLAGNLMMRFAMRKVHSHKLIPVGLGILLLSLMLMPIPFLFLEQPSIVSVMGPIGLYCIGVAFFLPTLSTAALGPFPTMAGAAASLGGFLQMVTGLLGGIIAGLMGDPLLAFATVIPLMGLATIVSWLIWRRLPEPAIARITARQTDELPPAA
ncbi:MAG: multidrug effflux MFS transporter [Rhizobiaceae bacterium]